MKVDVLLNDGSSVSSITAIAHMPEGLYAFMGFSRSTQSMDFVINHVITMQESKNREILTSVGLLGELGLLTSLPSSYPPRSTSISRTIR